MDSRKQTLTDCMHDAEKKRGYLRFLNSFSP